MRIALRRLSVGLVGMLAGLGLAAVPAAAEPAQITGTITAGDTGDPVQTCVYAYDASTWDFAGGACSDESGAYVIDGLSAGTGYLLETVSIDEFLGEWAHDRTNFWDADTVVAPAAVDFSLDRGIPMSGHLSYADGSPAAGAWVSVYSEDLSQNAGGTSVDENGDWSVFLRPGAYKVEFFDWPDTQWAFGQPSPDLADVFQVEPGVPVTVDDVLTFGGDGGGEDPWGGDITGTVTSAVDGQPLADVCARAIGIDDPWSWYGGVCTDEAGSYTISDLSPGEYVILFEDSTGEFVSTFYGGTYSHSEATPITVLAGETVSDVSIALGKAAIVTGRVVDKDTGAPLEGVCVTAYRPGEFESLHGQVGACSDAAGVWRIGGLNTGEITLKVWGDESHPPIWLNSTYQQADAKVFPVVAAETLALREARLPRGGTLTGMVTDEAGNPVEGAWVSVDGGPSRAGPGEGMWTARTDAEGRYTINNIAKGFHVAVVYSGDGSFAQQWSGGVSDSANAERIEIGSGKTQRYDFMVTAPTTITGEVVRADGEPLDQHVFLDLFTAASGDIIGWGAEAGPNFSAFELTGVPVGSFVLRATLEDGTEHWYDGAAAQAEATVIETSLDGPTHVRIVLL